MTWPDGRYGRALAGAYLVAFPVTWVGVVCLLIWQVSGVQNAAFTWLAVLFAVGAGTIAALSFVLRDRTSVQKRGMTGNERSYRRLALGLELPNAWRVLWR